MTAFPHSSGLPENAPAQDASQQSGNETPLHDILAGVDLPRLIDQRAEVIGKIRQVLDLLGEAENIAKQAHLGFPKLKTDGPDLTGPFAERARAEAALIQAVDAEAWKFLLDASRLSRFMDSMEHERWTNVIYSDSDTPELTMATITETFGRLHAERRAMFERKLMEIFRALSWDRQAALPRMLGKKLIVRDLTHGGGWPRSDMTRKVGDLERAFSVLDGKPESSQYGIIDSGISAAHGAGTDEMETDYLRIHWFQNGNGHITFKRHDLVTQMNGIARKYHPDALPAAQKAER